MRLLTTFFRSSTSYRLRIALNLKGLEWKPRHVSLPRMEHRAADYMELNPQGLLPALIEDDGAVLAQSLAIMEYLDERYPVPPLLPEILWLAPMCAACRRSSGATSTPSTTSVSLNGWAAAGSSSEDEVK